MRLRPVLKLFAVFLFYLFIALAVAFFPGLAGILTYPLIILASMLFILAMGLKVPLNGFLAGVAFAAVAMGMVVAILAILGAIEIGPSRDGFAFYLAGGIAIQLLVGFGEELPFRASIFQGLSDELGLWPAAILSSAGFSALHVPSMVALGLGVQSCLIAFGTIFMAGVALALLYVHGGLLNAVAFHATWNFIEYDLFNMGPLGGAIRVSMPGPDILTGGAFGPEASVVALAIATVLVAAVWLYYGRPDKKRKGTQPLST